MLAGMAFPYVPLPRGLTGLRARLVLISAVTATLALANVGVTASLMFLSFHDLILLLSLLVFSVGISAYVALILAEPTRQSVRELLGAAKRMSAGDLDTRVKTRSRDEVGEIGEAFNEMAGRLEAGVSRQRELEHARRDLITAVSYDLRTPLASVRAMVESMSDGVVEDQETVKRYLRTTLSEVDSLGRLVDDLFELSQIDAGMLELHVETASIDDLISDTLESMRAQAAARELSLGGDVEGQPLLVLMDTRRVQRVLYNLVQNSLRHTPPRRHHLRACPRYREGCRSGGCRYGRGHIGPGPAPRLRALVQGRPVQVTGGRRRRTRPEHSEGDRRSARWAYLGRERRGQRQQVRIHPSEVAPR